MNDRKTSYYEYSLWKLYWKSGLIGAILWGIAVVAVFVIGLFCRYETKEGLKLMAFMAVLGLVILYAYPTACMIRTLKQQAAIGIRWKDRREYDGEEMKREWYASLDGGGFLLYHRSYIKKIQRTVREDATDGEGHSRGKIYVLSFEDIQGKIRKIKFSSGSIEKEFRTWYKGEE